MTGRRKRIAVVVGSRANYASIKSLLKTLAAHPECFELLIFAGASALLDKYGQAVALMEEDGFEIAGRFHILVEGETPETMAMSTGLGIMQLAGLFSNHKPDLVMTVGDRFETLATAVAASYMNIRLAHTMGGEISGTIDESVRHAVTKLSHLHFCANEEAAERIVRMGEDRRLVFATGCPRIDLVREIVAEYNNGNGLDEDAFWAKYKGVGPTIDLSNGKFLLAVQHPVTTEYGKNREHMRETLMALQNLKMNTIMLWPNADAGSDEISKEIRTFRELYKPEGWLHVFKNLPMEEYIQLMLRCACIVGNSSSAIREGAIIGVPAVNVGTRQDGRLRGKNVLDATYDRYHVLECIEKQLSNGRYEPDFIYGDGRAAARIANILGNMDLNDVAIQKRIAY